MSRVPTPDEVYRWVRDAEDSRYDALQRATTWAGALYQDLYPGSFNLYNTLTEVAYYEAIVTDVYHLKDTE